VVAFGDGGGRGYRSVAAGDADRRGRVGFGVEAFGKVFA
jgi:hypothetical protein